MKFHVGEIVKTEYGTECVVLFSDKRRGIFRPLDPALSLIIVDHRNNPTFSAVKSQAMLWAESEGNLTFYDYLARLGRAKNRQQYALDKKTT